MQAATSRKPRGPRAVPELSGPAVWDRLPWCNQVGIGLSTFRVLKVKPKLARIGKLCKIVEAPAEYVRRVAAEQQSA